MHLLCTHTHTDRSIGATTRVHTHTYAMFSSTSLPLSHPFTCWTVFLVLCSCKICCFYFMSATNHSWHLCSHPTHALMPSHPGTPCTPPPTPPPPTATKPRHPQHLWTGPISNAPVEIIQGGRSVEVRPVGVTKGLAMQRIVDYMATTLGQQV